MVTPLQVTAEHIAQLHSEIVTTIFIATCENMYSPGYGVNPRQEGGVGFGNHLSPRLAGPAAARLHRGWRSISGGWEKMPQRRMSLMSGKGCELSQTKSMFLRTKNLEKTRWLIPASQGQEEASSWSAPAGPLLLLALWSPSTSGPPPSPSSPPPAPPVSSAKELTRRSDCGAGVSVLGAAVGALLVAVVLVGCNTFVAFQSFTCAKTGRRRSESGGDVLPRSPECPLQSGGLHGHWWPPAQGQGVTGEG